MPRKAIQFVVGTTYNPTSSVKNETLRYLKKGSDTKKKAIEVFSYKMQIYRQPNDILIMDIMGKIKDGQLIINRSQNASVKLPHGLKERAH